MSSHPLAWLDDALEDWERRGLRRRLTARRGPQSGVRIELDGHTYLNFGSNDYLGLAAATFSDSVHAALAADGWGSGASPLVTGRSEWHARLEDALAKFERTDAALLFPTGYAANSGTIPALVGPGDMIFSDARNHASIIDGCRLSGAHILVYQHADVDDLRHKLQAEQGRRRLLVTDTLFSMDGDLAPLPQLAEFAHEHNLMLMVDEAHATGVFGRAGRGVCESQRVEDGVHIRVGTLSKALGSHGGFVVGNRALIAWLSNRARSYVFSTSAPAVVAATGLHALEVVRREPARRQSLIQLAARLRQQLAEAGFDTGRSASQIVPVILGAPAAAVTMANILRDAGFWVPAIRPPSVPEGQSLLRISVTADHTSAMLDDLVEALRRARDQYRSQAGR